MSGPRGFFRTYLRRELRRRRRQSVLVALGLAVGIGLVVTVTAASAGVGAAQADVLHALYGIGTDVTVTTAAPPPPKPNSPQASQFMFSPGATSQHVDALGAAPGLGVLDAASVGSVARLSGVAAAAGGLTLHDTRITIPSLGELGPDGQPPGSATPTDFTVDGVDLAHPGLGPLASGLLTSGRAFTATDATANVALVDAGYAAAGRLTVGSTVTVATIPFRIIGIVGQAQDGGAVDVYLPLRQAQALARSALIGDFTGKVTTIYVAATGSAAVAAIRSRIAKLLPAATVTSAADLAGQASGSLNNAASLATDLGRWLAVAVLAAAFAVACLLTLAAVGRRVGEFGMLKALGWRGRRIIAQLLGESLVTGLAGAVGGLALGLAGAGLIDLIAPDLSATIAQNPGSALPQNVRVDGGGTHISIAPGATHTVAVHLAAQVSPSIIGLAVALALGGGLVTGCLGGWRATRLRPAAAIARVR